MESCKKETQIETLNDLLGGICKVETITSINFKPHPYCISEKHLKYNDSMYLWESQIETMEKVHWPMCWMYTNWRWEWANWYRWDFNQRCTLPYKEHTHDEVAVIVLQRDVSQDEISEALKRTVTYCESEWIDWFVFKETEEKYRVI